MAMHLRLHTFALSFEHKVCSVTDTPSTYLVSEILEGFKRIRSNPYTPVPILYDNLISIYKILDQICISNYESKKGGKGKESIQSSTPPDPWYHMGKWLKRNLTSQTKATRLALSQQVTTRQQWPDAKAWQTQDINNTNDPQKNYRLGTVIKMFYWRA